MTGHLSLQQLNHYRDNALDSSEIRSVGDHIATCEVCNRQYHELFGPAMSKYPMKLSLHEAEVDETPHLLFEEQIEPYLSKRLSEKESLAIENHLTLCEMCSDEVIRFTEFRQMNAGSYEKNYLPAAREKSWRSLFFFPGHYSLTREVWVVAVFGVIILSALTSWYLFMHGRTDHSNLVQQNQNANSAHVESGREEERAVNSPEAVTHNSIQENADNKVPVDNQNNETLSANKQMEPGKSQPKIMTRLSAPVPDDNLLKLYDGAQVVRLNSRGDLTGLISVPPKYRRLIAAALNKQEIPRPAALSELTGSSGVLLDPTSPSGPSFKLLSPQREVIVSDRPTFKWQPLSGATSQRVQVTDSDFHLAAQSKELSPTVSEWTVENPLPRGSTYLWVVTATKGGEEITAPGPAEVEFKFKVLGEDKMLELGRIKGSGSHLALGVFYAHEGLVEAAEREFQILARQNPNSGTTRKLLKDIHSLKIR